MSFKHYERSPDVSLDLTTSKSIFKDEESVILILSPTFEKNAIEDMKNYKELLKRLELTSEEKKILTEDK